MSVFRNSLIWAALGATGLCLTGPAHADSETGDIPLIENKLYPTRLKFEITPMYTYSLNDKYTHHTGLNLVLGFNIFDFLAVEVFGSYNLNGFGELNSINGWPSALRSGWTNLTKEVAFVTQQHDMYKGKPLELPDLYYQSWFAGADVLFSPFYGKWSIVSELGGSFSFYAVAGAGIAGTMKEGMEIGTSQGGPLVFPIHYGGGMRIYFTKWLALRVELRDYWWINPEVEEWNASDDTTDPCPGGYCMKVEGVKKQFTDFSRMTMVQAGVSFLL